MSLKLRNRLYKMISKISFTKFSQISNTGFSTIEIILLCIIFVGLLIIFKPAIEKISSHLLSLIAGANSP